MAGDDPLTPPPGDEPLDPEAPEATEVPTTEGDEPEPATPAKRAGESTEDYEKRIAELTRARRTAERERDSLKAELDAVKRKEAAGARPLPPDLATLTNADGQLDPVKYQRAITEYEDKLHVWREAQRAPSSRPADAEPEPSEATAPDAFAAGVHALAEKHADVYEVINRPVFTPAMRDAVWDSEQGPQLAYYLGQHQAEAMKLGQLPPAQMYRELGKLEARLSGAGAPAPRTVSAAPAPIEPVRGAGSGSTKDPEKMTIDEWMAHERARETERIKANPLGI